MKVQKTKVFPGVIAVLLLLAGSAQAEAFGDTLGRALTAIALYGLGYLAFLLLLIVLAVRQRRRSFMRVLAAGLAVILVYPLLDSGLLFYQKARVSAAEIRQPAPDLRERSILYIGFEERCQYTMCEALVTLQGGAPLWTIPPDVAAMLDFARPIDLSRIALARWMPRTAETGITLNEVLDGIRRPVFDYVVISQQPHYLNRASSVMKALPQAPTGTLLGDRLSVTDLAAPLEGNRLDLASIRPDLLTFHIARRARRAPLFLEHVTYGSALGWAWRESRADWFCGSGPGLTDAQDNCRHALR